VSYFPAKDIAELYQMFSFFLHHYYFSLKHANRANNIRNCSSSVLDQYYKTLIGNCIQQSEWYYPQVPKCSSHVALSQHLLSFLLLISDVILVVCHV